MLWTSVYSGCALVSSFPTYDSSLVATRHTTYITDYLLIILGGWELLDRYCSAFPGVKNILYQINLTWYQ